MLVSEHMLLRLRWPSLPSGYRTVPSLNFEGVLTLTTPSQPCWDRLLFGAMESVQCARNKRAGAI